MPGVAQIRAAKAFGAGAGLMVVAATLLAYRPEVQPPQLGASVSVRVASGGAVELSVPGGGPALSSASLRPGDPALHGRIVFRNRAADPLRVHLRPEPPEGGEPTGAWQAVRLRSGRRGLLAAGSVAEQHGAAAASGLVIPAGGRLGAGLRLEIPDDEGAAAQVAGENLSLVLVPAREPLR